MARKPSSKKPQTITAYHGTAALYGEAILRDGLKSSEVRP
jgi:hypothetical protein